MFTDAIYTNVPNERQWLWNPTEHRYRIWLPVLGGWLDGTLEVFMEIIIKLQTFSMCKTKDEAEVYIQIVYCMPA